MKEPRKERRKEEITRRKGISLRLLLLVSHFSLTSLFCFPSHDYIKDKKCENGFSGWTRECKRKSEKVKREGRIGCPIFPFSLLNIESFLERIHDNNFMKKRKLQKRKKEKNEILIERTREEKEKRSLSRKTKSAFHPSSSLSSYSLLENGRNKAYETDGWMGTELHSAGQFFSTTNMGISIRSKQSVTFNTYLIFVLTQDWTGKYIFRRLFSQSNEFTSQTFIPSSLHRFLLSLLTFDIFALFSLTFTDTFHGYFRSPFRNVHFTTVEKCRWPQLSLSSFPCSNYISFGANGLIILDSLIPSSLQYISSLPLLASSSFLLLSSIFVFFLFSSCSSTRNKSCTKLHNFSFLNLLNRSILLHTQNKLFKKGTSCTTTMGLLCKTISQIQEGKEISSRD